MQVIAYAYDADHHCESCMLDYARMVPYNEYEWGTHDPEDPRYSKYGMLHLNTLVEDEIIRDSEGNAIHPVFSTDEWYNIGEGTQTLTCTDCGTVLDTYEEDD